MRQWTRSDRLLAACLVLFLANLLYSVTIEAQVQQRNKRIDQVERTVSDLGLNVEDLHEITTSIRVSVNRLEQVAEEGISIQDSERLDEVFRQIAEIHDAIVASNAGG
jgi:uncharacterized protein YoxC